MTLSGFPTPLERSIREALDEALTEEEWIRVVFLARESFDPETKTIFVPDGLDLPEPLYQQNSALQVLNLSRYKFAAPELFPRHVEANLHFPVIGGFYNVKLPYRTVFAIEGKLLAFINRGKDGFARVPVEELRRIFGAKKERPE